MSDEFDRISKSQDLMQSLYKSAKENLEFKPDATIVLLRDDVNAVNPLGKTAYYDPANQKISLYTQGRHIKDIMRSLSHELVHHAQNCRGDFAGGIATVDGYAQEDGHLREMEREAYERGNLIFRDWEDGIKSENNSLFTGKVSIGEKLMENNKMEITETKLREVISGLVKEMLINVKEVNMADNPVEFEKAEAARQQGADADAAALAAESPAGEEEKWAASSGDEGDDEQNENVTPEDAEKYGVSAGIPGGGDKADEQEEEEDPEREAGEEEELGMDETFFPTDHDIRSKARFQTNETLMKRWGYSKRRNNYGKSR